jgi:uncharacterized SAM-binding protein YcdF (DUF218 family)
MAAQAYLNGLAPCVIASGGRRWGSQVEAHTLRDEVVRAGVPPKDIFLDLLSLTTHENALFSAALLRRLRTEGRISGAGHASTPLRVLVVTCSWHMPRALEDFRATGVDASPLPAEASPASPFRQMVRSGHERICRFLDRRAIRRSTLIERSTLP